MTDPLRGLLTPAPPRRPSAENPRLANAEAAARELAKRGATREQIERAVEAIMGPPPQTMPQRPVRPDASDTSRQGQGVSDLEAMGQMVANTAAAPMQVIPGAEAVQAGVRSVVRRQPYREARADIEAAKLPAAMALPLQAPVALATGRIPLSPAKAGALFGGASQALDADPDISAGDRGMNTALGAAGGAIVGKVADAGTMLFRSAKSQRPDQIDDALRRERTDAGRVNYAQVDAEARQAPTTIPAVRNLLNRPDIKPFADIVRNSRKYANAGDAAVLRVAYQIMGKQQRGLRQWMKANGYDATRSIQADDIASAKQDLLSAADPVMPSLRPAVAEHARRSGEISALGTGVDAADRAMFAPVSWTKLGSKSRAAYVREIRDMPREEQRRAVQGAVARARERVAIRPNSVSPLSGLATAITMPYRAGRVSSMLRETGADETQLFSDWLTRAGLAGVTGRQD